MEEVKNTVEDKEIKNTSIKKEKDNSVKFMIIIIFLLIALLLCFYYIVKANDKVIIDKVSGTGSIKIDTTASEGDVATESLEDRRVFFAGLDDTVISKGQKINLRNIKDNEDFVMKYEIYNEDTGELIFETDFIESDHYLQWDPYDQLEKGEYNILIKEIPYAIIDGQEESLTSGANAIKLTLK